MKRVINFKSLSGFAAVSVFVATEIIAAAGAAIWSMSGLLGLDVSATTVVAILIGVPSILGIIKTTMMAFEAETDPENN